MPESPDCAAKRTHGCFKYECVIFRSRSRLALKTLDQCLENYQDDEIHSNVLNYVRDAAQRLRGEDDATTD